MFGEEIVSILEDGYKFSVLIICYVKFRASKVQKKRLN